MKKCKIINTPNFSIYAFHILLTFILHSVTLIHAQEQEIDLNFQDHPDQLKLSVNDFDSYGLLYDLNKNETLLKGTNDPLCYNPSANIMNFLGPKEALTILSQWSKSLDKFSKSKNPDQPHTSLKAWFNYLGQKIRLSKILRNPQFLHSQVHHELGARENFCQQIFSPNGNEYVLIKNEINSENGQILGEPFVYTTKSGEVKFQLRNLFPEENELQDLKTHCRSAYFSQNGEVIVSVQHSAGNQRPFSINIWDAKNGSLISSLNFENKILHHFSLSSDGKLLLTYTKSQSFPDLIELWDTHKKTSLSFPSPNEIDSPPNPREYEKTIFATLSPDGKIVAKNTNYLGISLWHPEDTSLNLSLQGSRINNGAIGTENKVIFSPDSQYLVSEHFCNPSEIWDPKTGTKINELKNTQNEFTPCGSLFFSQDSKLIGGFFERTNPPAFTPGVGVWESSTGKLVQHFFDDDVKYPRTIFREPTSLNFSPDGTLLMTCGIDEVIRFWDLKTGHLKIAFDQYLMNLKKIKTILSPDFNFLMVNFNQDAGFRNRYSVEPVDIQLLQLKFYGDIVKLEKK
jgi:WD40 repeat protein